MNKDCYEKMEWMKEDIQKLNDKIENRVELLLTCIGLVLQNQTEIMKRMSYSKKLTEQISKTIEVNECIRKIVEPKR